jgi:uncharacterized membrane protein
MRQKEFVMYSKVKLFDHPIHPMFVAFPIALYTVSFAGFLVFQFLNGNAFWYRLGFFANMAGVAMAMIAAIPGLLDWAMGIPRYTEAKKQGAIHMTLNLAALAFFLYNAYAIRGTWNAIPTEAMSSVVRTGIGWLFTAAAGYYGWTLVSVYKVGVQLTPEQERLELWQEEAERKYNRDDRRAI